MKEFNFNEKQLDRILGSFQAKKSKWDHISQIIQVLAIIGAGVWTILMYLSHDRERNNVLLEISKNQNELSQLQTEQASLRNEYIRLNSALMEKEFDLKDFEIKELDIKERINRLTADLKATEIQHQENQISLTKSETDLRNLDIENRLSRQISWSFNIEYTKVRPLLFQTQGDTGTTNTGLPANLFQNMNFDNMEVTAEYLVKLNFELENLGSQLIGIEKHDLLFYEGLRLKNDSITGNVRKVNSPHEDEENAAIKWKEIQAFSYGTDEGFIGELGPSEKRGFTYQFYINLSSKGVLGVKTDFETRIGSRTYKSTGFRLTNYSSSGTQDDLEHFRISYDNIDDSESSRTG